MAIRIQSGCNSSTYTSGETSDVFLINIHDSEFSGPIENAKVGDDGFTLRYQAEDKERYNPILTSTVTVNLEVTNATIESFVTDMIAAQEGRFAIEILKNGSLFWVGYILTDLVIEEDIYFPYIFQITATDGIAKLKEVDYSGFIPITTYSLFDSFINHVLNVLNKTQLASFHTGVAFLGVSASWYPVGRTYDSADCPLEITSFDHRALIEIDSKNNREYLSYYDVLGEIASLWGARVFYSEGKFRFVQLNEFLGVSTFSHDYESDGTKLGRFLLTYTEPSIQFKARGGTYQYYPPLLYTEIKYNHFTPQNLVPGADLWAGVTLPDLDNNGGFSKLVIQFELRRTSDFKPQTSIFKWRLQVKVGSYYLVRTAIVQSNPFGPPTFKTDSDGWSTTSGFFEGWARFDPSGAGIHAARVSAISTAGIPERGDLDMIFDVFAEYDEQTGSQIDAGGNQTVWELSNTYFEVLLNGTLDDQTFAKIYSSSNTVGTFNTKRYNDELLLGDGPSGASFGHIEYRNDSGGLSDSTLWNIDGAGEQLPIGQLLANTILSGQSVPVKRMISPFYSNFQAWQKISLRGESFILSFGQFKARQNEWSGEWFYIQESAGNVIPNEEIDDKFPPPFTQKPSSQTPPSQTPTIGAPVKGIDAVYLPSLSPPAKTTITTAIAGGDTVTTIGIIANSNGYVDKQVVQVANPLNGLTETFEVVGNTPAGATSLNVTSKTASVELPEGSYVSETVDSYVSGGGIYGGSGYMSQDLTIAHGNRREETLREATFQMAFFNALYFVCEHIAATGNANKARLLLDYDGIATLDFNTNQAAAEVNLSPVQANYEYSDVATGAILKINKRWDGVRESIEISVDPDGTGTAKNFLEVDADGTKLYSSGYSGEPYYLPQNIVNPYNNPTRYYYSFDPTNSNTALWVPAIIAVGYRATPLVLNMSSNTPEIIFLTYTANDGFTIEVDGSLTYIASTFDTFLNINCVFQISSSANNTVASFELVVDSTVVSTSTITVEVPRQGEGVTIPFMANGILPAGSNWYVQVSTTNSPTLTISTAQLVAKNS